MSEPRAVLFDLDGTLVDLPVDIERVRSALRVEYAALGHDSSFRPILAEIERAATQVSTSDAERSERVASAHEAIESAEIEAAGRAAPRPGAGELVASLLGGGASGGGRCGVVTDNCHRCIGPALVAAGLADLEAALVVRVGRDDVDRAKPDPQGVRLATALLLPRGGELWMVGDSERDMQAATHAQLEGVTVRAIGVCGGRSSKAELITAGAENVLDSIDELVALLGS